MEYETEKRKQHSTTCDVTDICIQVYLGYYETALLYPDPIHGISSWDGYYLAMRYLPLNITKLYFILRE
jgi:hypothetical protein